MGSHNAGNQTKAATGRGLLTWPSRITLASESGSPVVFLLTTELLLSVVGIVVSQGQSEVSQSQAVYPGLVRKLQGKLTGNEVARRLHCPMPA